MLSGHQECSAGLSLPPAGHRLLCISPSNKLTLLPAGKWGSGVGGPKSHQTPPQKRAVWCLLGGYWSLGAGEAQGTNEQTPRGIWTVASVECGRFSSVAEDLAGDAHLKAAAHLAASEGHRPLRRKHPERLRRAVRPEIPVPGALFLLLEAARLCNQGPRNRWSPGSSHTHPATTVDPERQARDGGHDCS